MLLGAIAACAATDVVQIMEKQRTPLQALRVQVEAQRVGVSAAARFRGPALRARGAGITPGESRTGR